MHGQSIHYTDPIAVLEKLISKIIKKCRWLRPGFLLRTSLQFKYRVPWTYAHRRGKVRLPRDGTQYMCGSGDTGISTVLPTTVCLCYVLIIGMSIFSLSIFRVTHRAEGHLFDADLLDPNKDRRLPLLDIDWFSGMSNVLEDPSSEDIALIKKIYVKNHTRVSLKW